MVFCKLFEGSPCRKLLLHNHNLEVLAGDDVITAFGNGQKSKASFVNLNRRSFQFDQLRRIDNTKTQLFQKRVRSKRNDGISGFPETVIRWRYLESNTGDKSQKGLEPLNIKFTTKV